MGAFAQVSLALGVPRKKQRDGGFRHLLWLQLF